MSDHDQLFKTLIRVSAHYLDRPEALAPALAALMRPGGLTPARHKLECLRRIASAETDEAGRYLLTNCVETYVQWSAADQKEYDSLLAAEDDGKVTTMIITLDDAKQAARVEGMRDLVTGMIESRFGAVPTEEKRRIEAMDSPDELTRLADRLLVARSLDDLGL